MFSSDAGDELKRTLAGKGQELVLVYEDNLVDKVWGEARPNPPLAPLRVHGLQYSGMKVATKLANLRKELINAGATAIVITMLDEVAWLLNLVCVHYHSNICMHVLHLSMIILRMSRHYCCRTRLLYYDMNTTWFYSNTIIRILE